MGTPVIVKVQRPLAGNDPTVGVLIYDKKRKHTAEQPMDARLAEDVDFMEKFKTFWFAEWNRATCSWRLNNKAPWQVW